MKPVESERLITRCFDTNDLAVFHRLNGDEEIVRYIREPKSLEECRAFLSQVIAWYQDPAPNWRLALLEKDSGVVVGSFAIIPVGDTADLQLGYSLLKEYWGRGYATEITLAGIRYAFEELGLASLAAITEQDNSASQHVLKKAGFFPEMDYSERGRNYLRFRIIRS